MGILLMNCFVGSPFYSSGNYEGAVSLFSLVTQEDDGNSVELGDGVYSEPQQRFLGDWPNGRFGSTIATGIEGFRDVDGDGLDDILVAAPNRNADRGSVFLINSSLTEPLLLWEGTLEGEEMGHKEFSYMILMMMASLT